MEPVEPVQLVLEEKIGKEISESSRLEFLGKSLANNLPLSDAEYNTSGLLKRGGMADLPLLRTLSAICQKSLAPYSFWEVMDSFNLLTYASLAVSRTLLQQLLDWSELYFKLRRFILLVNKKVISMNYGSSTAAKNFLINQKSKARLNTKVRLGVSWSQGSK